MPDPARDTNHCPGACICPHTLEPGAEGIYDPLCPILAHWERALHDLAADVKLLLLASVTRRPPCEN